VSLAAYVVRRLLQLVPIALGVTILVFFLIHLVPGDPARTILGNHATPQKVALLHHEWGLDKPLPVQYWKFLGRMVRGDLGSSLFYSVPAGRLVLQRLPVTLWLIGFGTLLSVLVAVPLAVIAATNRNRLPDQIVRAVPLVGLGFPPFWLGIMLLLVFGLHLGRGFPVGGYGSGFPGHVHSMFLPALTVALGIAPILIRSLRASLLEVLESVGYADIPTFALAKEREEIFAPGRAEPIVQEKSSPGMFLVQRIRDEAHRFAITHHRKVRSKKALTSPLDSVEGIGPTRKRALLRHFGSVQAIREAPVEDIVALGVPERLARRLKETL